MPAGTGHSEKMRHAALPNRYANLTDAQHLGDLWPRGTAFSQSVHSGVDPRRQSLLLSNELA